MHDEMIRKVAELMSEQSAAYTRLESAAEQLSAALVRGEPAVVDSLTRAGESELMRMRARLLEITSALTKFAESRARETEKTALDATAREAFEAAAKTLLTAAKSFQKAAARGATLALGGSSFASACVQMCGIPPMTYRAPVLKKYAEGGFAGK